MGGAAVKRAFFTFFVLALAMSAGLALAAERGGTVTIRIDVQVPPSSRNVKPWFPYPTSDLDQSIEKLRFSGAHTNFTWSGEPEGGARYLFTEWLDPRGPHEMRRTPPEFSQRAHRP